MPTPPLPTLSCLALAVTSHARCGQRGKGPWWRESETALAWRAGRRVGCGGARLMLSLWGCRGRSAQGSGVRRKDSIDQSGFRGWGPVPWRLKEYGEQRQWRPGVQRWSVLPETRWGRGCLAQTLPARPLPSPRPGRAPGHGFMGPPPQGPGSHHSSSSSCKAKAMPSRCPREWSLRVLAVRGAC